MNTNIISLSEQHLSFRLGEELFALDIGKVKEVIEFTTVTSVPQTPDFIKGVINLRGGVVPVVDLKTKFGMGQTERTLNTCVIISEVKVGEESIVLGAMADAVDEVFDLSPEDIEPAPRIGTQINTDFLKGMGKKNDEFILLLDIDHVFSEDELETVSSTGSSTANDNTDGQI